MESTRTPSRSKTPWDDADETSLSPLEIYLRDKYKDHFNEHHPMLSETDEYKYLNSIPVTKCRLCGSLNIVKNGYTKGNLTRYLCKDCHHTFVITTRTIFENHKLPIEEWIEFCLNLFGFGSTSLTSKNNKNSITTTNYWLNKLFLLLNDYQDDIVLSNKVYIDEKYYKKRSDELTHKDNGEEPAGLSSNQLCIFTGCDNKGFLYARANGAGKPSQQRCWDALGSHIARGSQLIHDEERAHKILVDRLELKSVTYNSKTISNLSDKENPLRPINEVHDRIEKFLNSHSGFKREHLQDYLNLFVFMNTGNYMPLERVYQLIDMGLTKPISLKYRDLY